MRPAVILIIVRISLIAIAGAAVQLVGAQSPEAPRNGKQVLTVSTSIDHYPYSFRDKSGNLTGYAVDLLDAVAETMKVKLQRTEVSPEQDIANLREGRCDIGQFHAPVPGRKFPGELSQPVLINYGEVFARKGMYQFRTLAALRALRLKIAGPEQAVAYLAEQGIDRALLHQDTSPNCLKMLSKGEVDLAVMTRLTGLAQAHYLGIHNIEPLGADLKDLKVFYCISTRPGDVELVGRINEALATLSITGKTVEIYSKWFGRYEAKGLTQLQVLLLVMSSLAFALIVALWALHWQRQLRHRIAFQAEELRENEVILAEAQRFAHLGHWQFDFTGKRPPIWSAETYRIFERDPLLGPAPPEELVGYAVQADRERWRKAFELISQTTADYDLDLTLEPRSGAQKKVHVRARPIMDGHGHCVGWFGTVQDVTATRMAEEALRRSEQLLSAIYANLPIGLGAVENNGNGWVFISINPTAVRQLALPASPSSVYTIEDSGLAPESRSQWTDLFILGSKATEPLNVEIILNDLRSVHSVTVVSLDPVNDRQRCFFLIEDVTEKRRQDAEIAQGRRLRAIGEFVGGIAHEFNNLLMPITASSELLLTEWAHDPDLSAHLKVIAGAAKRSADLTRRLLSFGRKSEHRAIRFDLNTVVEANLQLMQHMIDRRIAIKSSMPQDLPPLFLDSNDLHQIILNLLVNARDTLVEKLKQYSRNNWHPQLRIEASFLPSDSAAPLDPSQLPADLAGWIKLTIQDNGLGMPAQVVERLFEPFYTTKGIGHGTGLGLATTWHLVADFGGRIDVESTLGEGSAFHVWIPVAPAPAPAPQQGEHPIVRNDNATRHFLLVEDEPAIAGVVEAMLARSHHRVTRASDGNQAWTMLSSKPDNYDAVIMDLNMPGMSGLELAQCARAAAYHCPMIVMSGRITEDEQLALACLHILDILDKPFTLEQLDEAVTKAFHRTPPHLQD
jgi:two-component system, cell cycle sensor histidine kinase and response regulator CckA